MVEIWSEPVHSTPKESRERLRLHKQRKTTACWPCRERKIKCDKMQPYNTCSKRQHPELCVYEQSKSSTVLAATPQSVLNPANNNIHSVINFTDNTVSKYTTSSSILEGGYGTFLGGNLTPSFVNNQTSTEDPNGRQSTVENALIPILRLNKTPGPYPFIPVVSDKSSIYKELPSDHNIIK